MRCLVRRCRNDDAAGSVLVERADSNPEQPPGGAQAVRTACQEAVCERRVTGRGGHFSAVVFSEGQLVSRAFDRQPESADGKLPRLPRRGGRARQVTKARDAEGQLPVEFVPIPRGANVSHPENELVPDRRVICLSFWRRGAAPGQCDREKHEQRHRTCHPRERSRTPNHPRCKLEVSSGVPKARAHKGAGLPQPTPGGSLPQFLVPAPTPMFGSLGARVNAPRTSLG
jgi:hypothetical protein